MNYLSNTVDFFLGAVGAKGFHGYFRELDREPGIQMHLIKAGPGCGKSTLMRKLSQASPLPVEHIHCSSDPDSLDGVIFQTPYAAVIDATAPHVLEPEYPGAAQQVIDLYHTMNADILTAQQGEIVALFYQCKALQERAARYISTAANLLEDIRRSALPVLDLAKLERYSDRLAHRYLPHTDGVGSERIRLLSAITPKGHMVFYNTVSVLAARKVVLHDAYSAAAPLILKRLRQHALDRGYEIITCPCPIHPDTIDHLFIPALNLAFLTSNSWHTMCFDEQKNIHCTRFEQNDTLKHCKKRLRFNRKAAEELLHQASIAQQEAKHQHDCLENYYKSAIEFSQVDEITTSLIQKLITNA